MGGEKIMAFGLGEIIIILLSFALVAVFGRGAFKNLLRTVFGAKQDFEEVKKEFETKKEVKA